MVSAQPPLLTSSPPRLANAYGPRLPIGMMMIIIIVIMIMTMRSGSGGVGPCLFPSAGMRWMQTKASVEKGSYCTATPWPEQQVLRTRLLPYTNKTLGYRRF
jgi:hypothetical protein